jgi:hypothetical protein
MAERALQGRVDSHSDQIHRDGAPGVLFLVGAVVVTALSLDVCEGKTVAIFGHRNPDKLREFAADHGRT